jgi:hypothetical protein
MTKATWSNWVEAPKSANFKHLIIKRCKELKITIDSITNEDLNVSFLERLFGGRKEMIYFSLSGDSESLSCLKRDIVTAIVNYNKD